MRQDAGCQKQRKYLESTRKYRGYQRVPESFQKTKSHAKVCQKFEKGILAFITKLCKFLEISVWSGCLENAFLGQLSAVK
jgi:hypothetical protein